ncbi:DJ-1/PfpI family protein [Pelagibacteraceae bacterium]|jgi:protease I|nr:DJ-1/PfpI family protein [Pelagibacteraceae bacterium]|tara:strand:- start:788 stop:1309 length:522 start_codon:yes stop_codon:yes gene_type:complete
MNKAIIISGNLAQDHEFIYPYYRLLEADFEVDVCMLEGKPVKGFLGTSLPPNKEQPVKTINQVNVDDYKVLVLPGGVKAMEKVRQEKKIIDFISKFNEQKKIIACICSGAQLLISAKVVKGRKIAGYYSMKDDLINAGAIYTDKPAVIDENIITTAHYKDMGPWMREVIKKIN